MEPRKRKSYEFLKSTSRSFAVVIQALDGDIRLFLATYYILTVKKTVPALICIFST